MVTIKLSDISTQKRDLLNIAAKKISSNKFTSLNEDFDSYLKVDLAAITNLLDTIESRVRKAEIIHHAFIASVDHATLCGQANNLPIKLEFEFVFGTAVISETIEMNDKQSYKETVDLHFQHFILLIASIYENCVRLTEILIKKVILHKPGDRPLSTPMLNYISFFECLMKLGYRRSDHLSACLVLHDAFLKKSLDPINRFRNAFIHGFQPHLESDGFNYRVNWQLASTFPKLSPDLDIDKFCGFVLTGTLNFISDLFSSLSNQIKYYKRDIPA